MLISAVRVKIYAIVNILGALKKPNSLFARKESNRCKLATSEANDSFGKGFHVLKAHVLKAHVLNRLMTGQCPRKSLQLRPKFHSLFLQNRCYI